MKADHFGGHSCPNFQLVAVMSHLGSSSSSGHYICFIKRQDKVGDA